MRPLVERSGEAGRGHGRDRGAAEDGERQHRDRQHRELDLTTLDLLADIFRRTADHQPRDEHRENGEQQEAVNARADATDDDLAKLDVE